MGVSPNFAAPPEDQTSGILMETVDNDVPLPLSKPTKEKKIIGFRPQAKQSEA